MLPDGATAMFTAEGKSEFWRGGTKLGALSVQAAGRMVRLQFRGPALITPPGVSFCDIENALAASTLDERMDIEAGFLRDQRLDVASLAESLLEEGPGTRMTLFGRAIGRIALAGSVYQIKGVARAGSALSALDDAGFERRQTIWIVSEENGRARGFGLRSLEADGHITFDLEPGNDERPAQVAGFAMPDASPQAPPERISALLVDRDGSRLKIDGQVTAFLPLMRPGPAGGRIFTSLGLARFAINGVPGAGMFEQSRLLSAR
jgi:hypothetical protein